MFAFYDVHFLRGKWNMIDLGVNFPDNDNIRIRGIEKSPADFNATVSFYGITVRKTSIC